MNQSQESFDQFIKKVIGTPPPKDPLPKQESFDEFIKKVENTK